MSKKNNVNKNKIKNTEKFSLANKKNKQKNNKASGSFQKTVLPKNAVVKNSKKKLHNTQQQSSGVKVVKPDNTKKLLVNLSMVCLMLLFVVVGQFFVAESGLPNPFSEGTVINGINVGDMSGSNAEKALATAFNEKAQNFNLKLNYEGKSWEFNNQDFTVNSNIHTILHEVQSRQLANSTHDKQVSNIKQFQDSGQGLNVAFNHIFIGLDEKIDNIIKEINIGAEDSEIEFTPNEKEAFNITKDKMGLAVDKEQLYHLINEQFVSTSKIEVNIPTIQTTAELTYEEALNRTKKVSSFTTNVSDSTGNRKLNVKLALEKINGLIVNPGEEVSFNKLAAPFTSNNGYKVATIIYNGQFVDGEGGGVCQSSTTLYNALLKADVEILEVYKHTLPVRYVPLALDAMVAEEVADLRFKNNKEYPIYIKAGTTSESAFVEVYGIELEDGLEIKPVSEIVRQLNHKGDIIKQDVKKEYTDKVLFVGEQHRLTYPRNGYEVVAYLEYYKNGELIDKKQIRKETYYPQQGVIVEGVEEKHPDFKDIESKVEKIEPDKTDSATFMFNIHNYTELPETIPTAFCP